jgi:drug/metabolite transporter (DMT)-like permease
MALTVFLFSLMATLLTKLKKIEGFSPVCIALYAHPFSLLALLLAAVVIESRWTELAELLRPAADLAVLAALGFLSPFAYFNSLSTAFARLPKRTDEPYAWSITWIFFFNLFAALLAGEALKPKNCVILSLGLFGAWLIITKGEFVRAWPTDYVALVLALLGAISFGLYQALLGTRELQRMFAALGPTIVVLGSQVFSFIYTAGLFLILLLFRKERLVRPTGRAILYLFGLGAGCFGLAYFSNWRARALLDPITSRPVLSAIEVSICFFFVPVLSLIFLERLELKRPVPRIYFLGAALMAFLLVLNAIWPG